MKDTAQKLSEGHPSMSDHIEKAAQDRPMKPDSCRHK